MTRIPLWALVVLSTAVAAGLAAAIRPGRPDVAAGAALGAGVAGGFAALAVAVVRRTRRVGGEKALSRMLGAFVGLVAARMIGYLALVVAAVYLGAGEPVSVCVGLAGGTLLFQPLEIAYLRKMS
jgi:hypothetical protein